MSAPGALGENEKSQPEPSSTTTTTSNSNNNTFFRKPSWPASRPPQQQQQQQRAPPTLAKPIIPHRPRSHEPTSIAMLSASDEFRHGLPKLRSTSSDLLKRMEAANSNSASSLQPGGVSGKLKKASVDDLRRIYEERAGAAEVLGSMHGGGRRGSYVAEAEGEGEGEGEGDGEGDGEERLDLT
ncbi:hypothetical protein Q7P37_009123 [Cladosporium fusiforme]